MSTKERALHPVKRIHGGAHLPHYKNSAECETEILPPPPKVYIPLSQHIGAPANPIVNKGDKVYVGTVIGEEAGYISAPIHSSVSGTVNGVIDKVLNGSSPVKCIEIESDGEMTPDPDLKPFRIRKAADLAEAAKRCGLVGLGGAGFPAHVKLSPSKDSAIDTLIINAAECEPYITSDYRECIENVDGIIAATYLLRDKLKLQKVIICVENNKPKAIEKLMEVAANKQDVEDTVKLMKLPSTYPQGAEKVIIYSATGRKVPLGKLPSDVGCIVMNVTSLATLYRFISTGMPLVSKRITVDGTAVTEPKNLLVPIGTPIGYVLEHMGVDTDNVERIIMGGPMMGQPVSSPEAVIEKRSNAILAMGQSTANIHQTACIRCGRCQRTCPMHLTPARVETAYRKGDTEAYKELNINYCIECGSCSYICPAKRPLTEVMRIAKGELRRQKK
ncbi:MAG: electron transport complex subunit RsxC [Clostridia bacterium]|nr:electron transport complex subunit RsxC [Clostridia bacterium]